MRNMNKTNLSLNFKIRSSVVPIIDSTFEDSIGMLTTFGESNAIFMLGVVFFRTNFFSDKTLGNKGEHVTSRPSKNQPGSC